MTYYHSCPNYIVLSDTELSNKIISLLHTMNNVLSITRLCNLHIEHLLAVIFHPVVIIFGSQ